MAQLIIDATDNNGRTPASHACERGNHEIVEIFLHYGADFSIKDTDGKSPLEYAELNGHHQLVAKIMSTPAVNSEKLLEQFLALHPELDNDNSHNVDVEVNAPSEGEVRKDNLSLTNSPTPAEETDLKTTLTTKTGAAAGDLVTPPSNDDPQTKDDEVISADETQNSPTDEPEQTTQPKTWSSWLGF